MKNKKNIYIILLVMISVSIFFGCANNTIETINKDKASSSKKVDTTETENILKGAKEIKIEETTFNLGKKYKIYVDKNQVAEITGKFFNNFGDEFILKDMNGNTIESEKQIKRWGTKLTRGAQVLDKDNNAIGYIGEEVISKLTSAGYFFHFYDKEKEEIGTSDQVVFSFFLKNIFKDNDGNEDYELNGNFSLISDSYTLTVKDTSNIPVNQAIFMVCIEDAIKDSKDDD